ncbi:unnamed protein product [Chondrus crispus]|uniref:Uncharacterized protein n=1 Tax=Chondrus crispus TaxID=2769 RepID=R7QGM8_CHOCR|nr:unnamed protein product [Chondrus crispus]XP_005718994.1 unnamed protein product [Chondrus crispus]CDF36560.1 unnamed protein product [Chondrus crispus]CDF39083.1 unnamed protein product [Chondrus crispus]|eukprot:XP_005716379.1 unnamed protein product [Chondrus crispus]
MTNEQERSDESQETNLGIQTILKAVQGVMEIVRKLTGVTVSSEEALSAIIEESESESDRTSPNGGAG